MKNKIIAVCFMLATAALAVVSFFLLPETVITQLGSGGGTTMPRAAAITLPTLIGTVGSIIIFLAKDNAKSLQRGLILSAVGVLAFAFTLAVNL